jgi:hypothetical protein
VWSQDRRALGARTRQGQRRAARRDAAAAARQCVRGLRLEEWVDRSRGRIRADVVHQRLVAMGYMGSERTTRRAVAEAKRRWRAELTRPWVVEPGAVDAVGVRRQTGRRGAPHGVVLRVACVVALPGRAGRA